ncbi:MAG: hypothetical protein V2I39_11785, partial [Erythrobacter sp.]|nr:hypothetical protein [Erythrobacter sp.]
KLLRYLVDRALAGGPAPTQYEIAVEALGKAEDFDLANDSYPRVQVSRLRSSLDSYYARSLPREGHRLLIESGQYEVRLAPYRHPGAPAPEPAARAQDDPAAHAPASDPAPAPPGAHSGRRGRRFVAIPLASAGIVVAGLFAWAMPAPEDAAPPDLLQKPAIVLQSDLSGLDGNGAADRDTAQFAVRLAEILLAYSLVSDTMPETEAQAADYTLTLNFVQEPGGRLQAFLGFSDAKGKTLFNELVEYDPARPERFVEELRSALGHITAPTGEVAQDRRAAFGESLGSGYACFITIENRRAGGGEVGDLLDPCIERHLRSEYGPYFRARRAFDSYRTRRAEGEPIRASGPAWRDLQLALEADPFNSFANLVAGKVLLAEGNCDAARSNLRIAYEQATTYPALRASIDAEVPGCPDYDGEIGLSDRQLRAMIASSPAADALHHLYMLVAALAADDMRSARMLAARPQKPMTEGREMDTVKLLHRALGDPAFAKANAQRLRAGLAPYVWGSGAVDRVMANLLRPDDQAGRRSASLASRAKI